jgi:glyoxylase-like metal-dependent hydrolase (beta-lactamase superfamily II)
MNSLDKLGAYDFDRIAPGHGDVIAGAKNAVEKLHAHRTAREDKVLRCLAGASTLESLTAVVYDDVPVERHPWARFSLEAHLIKLVREGRVSEHDGVWRVRRQ